MNSTFCIYRGTTQLDNIQTEIADHFEPGPDDLP
jgi:hypothetical protein